MYKPRALELWKAVELEHGGEEQATPLDVEQVKQNQWRMAGRISRSVRQIQCPPLGLEPHAENCPTQPKSEALLDGDEPAPQTSIFTGFEDLVAKPLDSSN